MLSEHNSDVLCKEIFKNNTKLRRNDICTILK